MKLPGNIPLDPVLSLAQGLLQRLREDEYCPHELRVSEGEGWRGGGEERRGVKRDGRREGKGREKGREGRSGGEELKEWEECKGRKGRGGGGGE